MQEDGTFTLFFPLPCCVFQGLHLLSLVINSLPRHVVLEVGPHFG